MVSTFRRLGLSLVLVLSVLGAGCADAGSSPLAARQGAPAFNTGASPDMTKLARFRQTPQITIAWAKKWIGPEGGRATTVWWDEAAWDARCDSALLES